MTGHAQIGAEVQIFRVVQAPFVIDLRAVAALARLFGPANSLMRRQILF